MPVATPGTKTPDRDLLGALHRQVQSLGACVQLLRASERLHTTSVRQLRDGEASARPPEEDLHALHHTTVGLRQHLDRLHALVALHRLYATAPPTTQMLRSIVRATSTLLRLPHVAIWTADTATQTLVLRAASDARLRRSFPQQF